MFALEAAGKRLTWFQDELSWQDLQARHSLRPRSVLRSSGLRSTRPSCSSTMSMPAAWRAASAPLPAGGQDRRELAPPYRGAERHRRAAMAGSDQRRCRPVCVRRQPHRHAARTRRRRRHDRRWRRPDHAAEAKARNCCSSASATARVSGPDRVHVPVYVGLGNHDLDQNGPPPHVDWYRRELRDYVEVNHRAGVFFKPPVPATQL